MIQVLVEYSQVYQHRCYKGSSGRTGLDTEVASLVRD